MPPKIEDSQLHGAKERHCRYQFLDSCHLPGHPPAFPAASRLAARTQHHRSNSKDPKKCWARSNFLTVLLVSSLHSKVKLKSSVHEPRVAKANVESEAAARQRSDII